jgi:hypothetical protein
MRDKRDEASVPGGSSRSGLQGALTCPRDCLRSRAGDRRLTHLSPNSGARLQRRRRSSQDLRTCRGTAVPVRCDRRRSSIWFRFIVFVGTYRSSRQMFTWAVILLAWLAPGLLLFVALYRISRRSEAHAETPVGNDRMTSEATAEARRRPIGDPLPIDSVIESDSEDEPTYRQRIVH